MTANDGTAHIYEDSCLRVEHDNYFVACKGTFVSLTKTEFLLVSRLSQNLNRVVQAQELWEFAWGSDKPFNPQCLHVFLYRVRRKLMPFGMRIENMVNIGYGLLHGSCCERRGADRARPTF